MTRYNHFKKNTARWINFADLEVGQKFRKYLWRGKVRRNILCIKTGQKKYIESRSKKEHTYLDISNIQVMEVSGNSSQP